MALLKLTSKLHRSFGLSLMNMSLQKSLTSTSGIFLRHMYSHSNLERPAISASGFQDILDPVNPIFSRCCPASSPMLQQQMNKDRQGVPSSFSEKRSLTQLLWPILSLQEQVTLMPSSLISTARQIRVPVTTPSSVFSGRFLMKCRDTMARNLTSPPWSPSLKSASSMMTSKRNSRKFPETRGKVSAAAGCLLATP